jgi:hypothetical protein
MRSIWNMMTWAVQSPCRMVQSGCPAALLGTKILHFKCQPSMMLYNEYHFISPYRTVFLGKDGSEGQYGVTL